MIWKESLVRGPRATALVLLLFMSAVLVSRGLGGEESVVVANESVFGGTLTKKDVKDLFLGRKSKLAGARVEIVILEEGVVHDGFVKEMMGKSPYQYTSHWKRLVLTGKGQMPRAFASEGDLLWYVSRTQGAVGYVGKTALEAASLPQDSVKVLEVLR